MRKRSLPVLVLLLWVTHMSAETRDVVVYAPDVVGVDRLFLIALRVPKGTPALEVRVPASVTMLDRTGASAKTDVRRFYFRSVKAAKSAEIGFRHPQQEVTVRIAIWSFGDLRAFRELKGIQLPRRWPLGEPLPELKTSQTITSEARKKAAKGPASGRAKAWLKRSDDDIWAVQPDMTIPRWHWVNLRFGCPVHGTDIYRKRAYYPWQKPGDLPHRWKIICPVGGEAYPSNDFASGDMTSGEFPDDGMGGCLHKGKRYGFIAEICQYYCHQALRIAPECAQGYLATGDVRYAHKALVAMSRLAVEYAYLATMTHHRHRNRRSQVERFGPAPFREGPCLGRSGFTVYCIDQPTYQRRLAEAYDQIFPAIDRDPEIVPFLQRKGYAVKTHEDVRRFIEENLFAVWMQGAMDWATSSNEPYPQWGLARMAEALNYKRGTGFMDWLYDGQGKMRVFVPNAFFRDGAPYESTGGYNGMHVVALGPIIESIEHLRQLRPDVYPESKYPNLTKSRRYHNIFDFAIDTVTIDRSYPYIGDTGSFPRYTKLPKLAWQHGGTAALEHAYRFMPDPKFARALVRSRGWRPSLDFPFTREQIEREAAQQPDDGDSSSLHDGYGMGILRGGSGDHKRAFWLRYGRARGHTQDDLMDLGLDAFQGKLLQHMGYPRNWGYWEHSWTSHNVARQMPFVSMTATAQLFADAGPVHLVEARAQAYSDRVDSGQGYRLSSDNWQRRMLVLVDAGPGQFYCVDFYRIAGGKDHWWCFHAQEGDFKTKGLSLVKQMGGTLAGPDVPYGDEKWLKKNGCRKNVYGWGGPMFGFAHLYNVERAKATGPWSADWALRGGEGLHLRLTVVDSGGCEAVICDGTSPAGGKPYEMKWVLLHGQGKTPLKTQVLSLIEPYRESPLIREVKPLVVTGADEEGLAAVGCTVRLGDRTDTLFASADPTVDRTAPGGFEFAGRFGFYSERSGKPVAMVLVGGTRLRKGNFGITSDRAEYRARIVKVERATETITVAPGPPDTRALVGQVVFITNPVRRIAYKVVEARKTAGGAELRLDLDSRIGTGKVTGVKDHRVLTDTPFPLHRFRYYHGARLVNAARTIDYKIVEVRSKGWALVDAQSHPEARAARLKGEFPANTWFEVYDYGVGDEVLWPCVVAERGQARQ